jgi:hypothetical protein
MTAFFKRFLRDVLYLSALLFTIFLILSIVHISYLFVVDRVRVAESRREQRPQEEIRAAMPDVTSTQLSAQDLKDVEEGRGTDEQKAKVAREEARGALKGTVQDRQDRERLKEIEAIKDKYKDRLGPERRKMLDDAYKGDVKKRHKMYKQDAEHLERNPDKVYK